MTVYVIDKLTGYHKRVFHDVVRFDSHTPNEFNLWIPNDNPKQWDRLETIQVDSEKERISVFR